MKRNNYDPRWITTIYPGHCIRCKGAIARNQRAFYFPRDRAIYCEECGKAACAQFRAEVADETFFTGCQ